MKIKALVQCILFSASFGHGMQLSVNNDLLLGKVVDKICTWAEFFLSGSMSQLTINDDFPQTVAESITQVEEPTGDEPITIDEPPLITAIEDGDLNKVKELCTPKNVNKLFWKQPPLAYALQSHQWKIAHYLIKQNAITCFTLGGQNPLHIAAQHCKPRLLKQLLKTQLYKWVNKSDAYGDTPLTLCAPCSAQGDKKMALDLINKGASMCCDHSDYGQKFIEVINTLSKDRDFVCQCLWEACCYALKNRLADQLNELFWYTKTCIKDGVNVADKDGNTLLHKIVNSFTPILTDGGPINKGTLQSQGFLGINKIKYFIGLLRTYGANPQQKNKAGESPLDIVAKQGNHVLTLFLRAHR